MRPMWADLVKVVLLLIGMFGSSKAVEFIQFNVLGRNARDDLLVGGFGLLASAIDPTLYGGWVNLFDAGDSFRAQPFESLIDRALHFLLGRLEIVKGRAVAVTEGPLMLLAADDRYRLAVLQRVTAVIT